MLESFINILNGKTANEIVWTADLEFWIAGQKLGGTFDSTYDSEEGRLKLSRELEILPYYWYENFWLAEPEYENVEYIEKTEGHKSFRRWKTPVGILEEISFFSEAWYPPPL